MRPRALRIAEEVHDRLIVLVDEDDGLARGRRVGRAYDQFAEALTRRALVSRRDVYAKLLGLRVQRGVQDVRERVLLELRAGEVHADHRGAPRGEVPVLVRPQPPEQLAVPGVQLGVRADG